MIVSNQTVHQIASELGDIQAKLNLRHWRIEVSSKQPAAEALFEVVTNRNRNHAMIRVSEAGANHPDRKRLLTHEVLHILFDPIREEHEFQMDTNWQRKVEYEARMLREIEKAVEHLSYVV